MGKKKSPFLGLWHIVSMSQEDEAFLHEEGQAFINFQAAGWGKLQIGLVSGDIDYLETQRDGKPTVEWSWEGMAEMDECSGRGWSALEGDELRGMVFVHGGEHSDFIARKPKKPQRQR